MTDPALDDEDLQRASRQAALDHAWAWFALRARQRMQCVNFFFVAVAFLAAGYVTALTRTRPGLAVGIGALGAWLAIWFDRLDQRTRQLVDAGQDAMAPLQQGLALETGNANLSLVTRVEECKQGSSYGTVLRVLHGTAVVAFLIGAGYAATVWAGLNVEDGSMGRFRTLGTDPWRLQGIGLGLGFVAAVLLAYFPPQIQQYTRAGAAHVTFTGATRARGTRRYWLSWAGPVLLAASFAVQGLAWWRS